MSLLLTEFTDLRVSLDHSEVRFQGEQFVDAEFEVILGEGVVLLPLTQGVHLPTHLQTLLVDIILPEFLAIEIHHFEKFLLIFFLNFMTLQFAG
jgi:hypothetical protein